MTKTIYQVAEEIDGKPVRRGNVFNRQWLEKLSSISKPVDCLTSARCAGDAGENASRTARKSGK